MHPTDPIGFFDSGLGGISVLRQTRKLLPGEDYLYFGDSLHAPYGVRPLDQVQQLCLQAVDYLMEKGIKALVLACNTATSAAVPLLRQKYPDLPIIGTEPALKPAVEQFPGGRILVMATAMTLKEQKFLDLWHQYDDQAQIVPVPCSGLMEFVERGELEGEAVTAFLLEKLEPFTKVTVDAVVLGCTHYPFLRPVIRKILGKGPEIMDGAGGVARQLNRLLEQRDLRNPRHDGGSVIFENSLKEKELLQRCEILLRWPDPTEEYSELEGT